MLQLYDIQCLATQLHCHYIFKFIFNVMFKSNIRSISYVHVNTLCVGGFWKGSLGYFKAVIEN